LAIAAKMSICGHILTGPIYIKGAEAGHALELQIPKVKATYPWAYNAMGRNGALANQFPEPKRRAIPMDLKRNVALFAQGVEIPSPPGIYAGNLDNKE